MNTKKNILLPIILFSLFQSCYNNDDSKELLEKAEAHVISNPDSALFYLGSIITPQSLSDSDYAKYAVLLVRTHCKTNVSLLSDTIINHSINFYTKESDDLNLARAYLQAGRVKEEEKDYVKARTYYLDAMRLAMKCEHFRLVAICSMEIADMSFLINNYTDALKWLNISLDHYTNEQDKQGIKKKIADCYIMMDQPNEALQIYRELEDEVGNRDNNFRSDIYINKALIHYKSGEYPKAIDRINTSLKLCENDELYAITYLLKADIYIKLHQYDSVYYCSQKAIEYASLSNRLDIISNISTSTDRNKLFLKYSDEAFWNITIDTYISKTRYQTFSTLRRIYNNQKAEYVTQTLIIRNQQYIIVIAVIFLALILIGLMYIRSRKYLIHKHKKGIEQKEEVFAQKETELISKINYYQSTLEDNLLMYRKLVTLSLINDKNGRFLLDFNRILFNHEEPFEFDWGQFKILLNQVYPQFEDKLLSKYSEILSEKEIEVILLQKGGFEINEISEILVLSPTTIYHRNSDIRKKLNMVSAQDIIAYLNQNIL